MKVTISKAADLVGITRATLYRHIDKKGITVEKDDDDNPKIDVAELVRVYGDKVKTPQQLEQEQAEQGGEPSADASPATQVDTNTSIRHETQKLSQDARVELEVLRERLRGVEDEREREREILSQQIENLRETLEQSQEQQKRLTLLITNQQDSTKEEQGRGVQEQAKDMEDLRETIDKLKRQNRTIYKRLKQEEDQRSQSFWQKLFG